MSKIVSKIGVQDVVIMDSCLATMSKTLSQCKGVEIVTRCIPKDCPPARKIGIQFCIGIVAMFTREKK